jgi:hypothetical protein
LPVVVGLPAAITFLETVSPTLIRNGKLFLYSPKLADGVRYFLNLFTETTPPNTPIVQTLTGLYRTPEDFIQRPQTLIFTSERDLTTWQRSLLSTVTSIQVRTRLALAYGNSDEPYVYIAPSQRIFLVQNVVVDPNSESRALNVGRTWEISQVNLGRNAPPLPQASTAEQILPNHVIYGISEVGQLERLRTNTTSETEFLEILYYGGTTRKYGALLSLQ